MADGGDEAAGVDVEEGLGFLVGVDFDVLVGELLVLERDPDALDEGAAWVSDGSDVMIVKVGLMYQKQLPKSLRSSSLE